METTIPKARDFLKAWIDATMSRKSDLINYWCDRRRYTAIIKDDKDSVVKAVAKNLNLHSYSEYYHTDTIFFSPEDLVPGIPQNQTWVRGIKIAFEHEHSFDNHLFEEISHLLIVHSPLSVVVTYPPQGDIKNLPHFDGFHSIINGSPRAMELHQNESFLWIFGYDEPFEWKGVIFKSDGWKPLSVDANEAA